MNRSVKQRAEKGCRGLGWAAVLWMAMLAVTALGGCGGGSSSDAATPASTTIGTTGGTVSGPDGSSASIPAGALSANTRFTIATDVSDAPALPAGVTPAGKVYALTPHGTSFAQPVTVSIPFTAASVPSGSTPVLYKAERGGSFAPIAASVNGSLLVAQVSNFSYFVPVVPSGGAVAYSALSRTCARQALSGVIDCWGDIADVAQVQVTGPGPLVAKPTTVAGGLAFGQFSYGGQSLCGIHATEVWCAGANYHGLLGDGTYTPSASGVKVAAPAGIHFGRVAVGYGHACALVQASAPTDEGKIYCWGSDVRGELGLGKSKPTFETLEVTAIASPYRYVDVVAAGLLTCALRTTGEVDCWGDGIYGQFGQGYDAVGYHTTPTQIPGVTLIVAEGALATNGQTSCGLKANGETVCWGYNSNGQVGDGTRGTGNTSDPNEYKRPTVVAGGLAFKRLAMAGDVSCGSVATGETYCWGALTSTNVNLTPTIVGEPRRFKVLTATSSTTFCGIGWDDGRTYCWGGNDSGELGQGNSDRSTHPTPNLLPNQ